MPKNAGREEADWMLGAVRGAPAPMSHKPGMNLLRSRRCIGGQLYVHTI